MTEDKLAAFEEALGALIERFGGTRNRERESACIAQIVAALAQTSGDGKSLSPLDVVRIRAGKYAATRLPARLYREPASLAALRREIEVLARALLGESGSAGSRFG